MSIDLINSGICQLCGTFTTNVADGKFRPFCATCERSMNEKIAQTKVGKKFPNASLQFPSAEQKEGE